jgi:hypothetical protein
MKKLLWFVVFAIINNLVLAEEMISVSSLSDGACMVYDGDGSGRFAKVASFNQSLAWIVDESSTQKLKEDIARALMVYGQEFSDNKYEVYLHCGAYGTSLMYNIDMRGFRVCAWAEMMDKKFVLRNLASTNQAGICHGQVPGRLVIYTTGQEATDIIEKELNEPAWRKMINFVAAGGYGKVTVFLTNEYTFSEHKVKDALLEAFDKQYIKFIEQENLYHPAGEFKLLDSLVVN